MSVVSAAAVVGIGTSLYSASKSGKTADAAARGADAQAALGHRQADMAEDQYNRYKEIYDPLERGIVDDAARGIDAGKYVGKAMADVGQQFSAQRDALTREMGRYGLNPASGRWQGARRQLGLAEALGKAQAANTTRMAVDDANWSRKMSAISLGKGLPTNAMSGMGSAAATMGSAAGTNMGLAQAQGKDAGSWANLSLNLADKAGWFNSNQSGIAGVNSGSQQDQMLASQWS